MNKNLTDFAYKLCSIPSITGNEINVLEFMCADLEKRGLFVEKIPVDESRYNIFTYYQKRPQYTAIFCTHLDTVAPFIEPKLDQDQGILYGRGACDAKGIAAAMIDALSKQYESGQQDLALLFTVGEEEASDGAKACNEVLSNRAKYLIVGEPTELRAAYAQKGSIVFDLIAHGKEAHSSTPHLGDSAIHKLTHSIQHLLTYSWPSDEYYQETLLNIGELSGGHKRNVLAPKASAKCIMRTAVPSNDLIPLIKSCLGQGVEIKILSTTDPFDYVVPKGVPTFLAGFGSDAPHLHTIGKPILIGPGSLLVAHTPDEHISFIDLLAGVATYQHIADKLRAHNNE